MSKLLPCPFCGGEARMWPSQTKADQDGSYEIIGCSNIECLIEPTTEEYLPYEEAVKRWNTRPTPAPCDELKTVGHLWEYAEYYRDDRGWYGYVNVITEENPAHHVSPIEKVRNHDELVTRQNAEAVIAAKDARITELEADNKRLREALEFYASQGVYKRDGWSDRPAPAISDGGKKARAALGKVKP